MPYIHCFTYQSGPVNMPYTGMFHMSLYSLLSLHVSLIELLTDSITLIENAIIIKYYWQQFRHNTPPIWLVNEASVLWKLNLTKNVTQLRKKGKQSNETNQSQYSRTKWNKCSKFSFLGRFSQCSFSRRTVSWIRRLAAAAAFRLGRNTGAPGSSSAGLSASGFLSHTSSNGSF